MWHCGPRTRTTTANIATMATFIADYNDNYGTAVDDDNGSDIDNDGYDEYNDGDREDIMVRRRTTNMMMVMMASMITTMMMIMMT